MSRRGSVLEGIEFKGMDATPQYRAADNTIQLSQLDLQRDQLKQQKAKEQKSNLAATQKWIDDNYDPNKNLSGNPLADPAYNKKMAEINMKAYQLAEQGADINTIKMMLGSDADNLTNYSRKAKAIKEGMEEELKGMPINSGYRKDVLLNKGMKKAMLDDDGNIKSDIDEKRPYLREVLSEDPLSVTTNEGLQGFVNHAQTNAKPDIQEVKTYNNRGGYEKKKLKITAPDWMVLDTDDKGNSTRQLVPKYEIATEDGSPIMHTFTDKDGKQVKAAVRLVDDTLFNNVLKSSPAYSDNLRGQVMEVIKSGEYKDDNGNPIELNSPQAKNVAKALMYDDLKLLSKGGVEDIVETKPTQIKITNSSGSSRSGEVNINDVYKQIDDRIEQSKKEGAPYLQLNLLPGKAPNLVLEEARKASGDNTLEQQDIMLIKDKDGIGIFKSNTSDQPGLLIKYIDKVSTNLPNQPNAKSKAAVVKEGNENNAPASKPKIVEQNGHRYQLNEKTGKYEPIK